MAAALLLVALIITMLGSSFMSFQTGDTAAALATGVIGMGLLVGSVMYVLVIQPRRRGKAKDALLQWVLDHRQILQQGQTLIYRGAEVTRDSQLVQYVWVVSVITLSSKMPGRWVVPGSTGARLQATGATLCCLLLGWWGIPWGPVFTVQGLAINVRGGQTLPVAAVLAGEVDIERHR